MISAYSKLKKREKQKNKTYWFFNKQIDNYVHKENMNRKFIFTFILLATLSTVYAIPYQPRNLIPSIQPLCSKNEGQFNLSVSPNAIIPGSPFTLNLSGKLNEDVDTGSIFNAAFLQLGILPGLLATFSDDFCTLQGINCPIPAGVEINTVIQEIAPDTLPESFTITAAIISQKNNFVAYASISGSASS